MLDMMVSLYQSGNWPRLAGCLAFLLVDLGLLIHISICDIKRKSVTFWKVLLTGSMLIIGPLVMSLFYNCEGLRDLKLFMPRAFIYYIVLLYLNIKFNRDSFMGKADVDLLAAVASLGVAWSQWAFSAYEAEVAAIRVTAFWYSVLGYLLVGALAYLVVFFIFVLRLVTTGKKTIRELMHDTTISLIPMFVPVSLATTALVMMH